MLRRVAILGSTGSIGSQTLQVIAAYPDRFLVVSLAAGSNVERLAEQANEFRPKLLSIADKTRAGALSQKLSYVPDRICYGEEGLVEAATAAGANIVVAATDGMAALHAVFESISRGLHVALANKELLVGAGRTLCALARSSGARLLPVDSEHSALFQCLAGEHIEDVASVVLTASGGPFWTWSLEEMERATPQLALRHPIWRMGAKNTIDSATLMNKGLEVIEASFLFHLPASQIEVVVHRQSIVHGLVIFADGNVKAQLAAPDMRLPIGFALAYPERLPAPFAQRETKAAIGMEGKCSTLSFEPVDERRFPSLGLAYRALALGGTYPAVLSAANEEAGRAFLQGQIKFTDICPIVEGALTAHVATSDGLDEVKAADSFGRAFARRAAGEAARR